MRSSETANRDRPAPETDRSIECLSRSVSDALAREPQLEAVTLDRDQEQLSIATLGKNPPDHLEREVAAAVLHGREAGARAGCGLLDGTNDCRSCPQPLSGAEAAAISVKRSGGATTISRVTCPTAPTFWRWKRIPFPHFVQREVDVPEDERHLEEWKWQLAAAGLCGLLGLTGFWIGSGVGSVAAYLAAYVAGAWFAIEEIRERIVDGALDVHFLMVAVAVGSASIGAWGEGAMLLFLFSLSGALEHYAMGRTQREIQSLFKSAPKTATLIGNDGIEEEVPVTSLRKGMRLLVKPGSQFPVDAEIAKGETSADESNLTGEATPIEKRVGDSVLSGTANLWGAVEVMVLRPAAESALQKIIRLIREAQRLKAPSQRFTDRFGSHYTYLILGLTLVMFFVWWLGFGLPAFLSTDSGHSAFYRAMTLLVVASPCALVLSIPSAILAAIAWAARHGILFRGGAAVEKLAEIQTVALDKTGTLTTGDLEVERVDSFPAGRESDVAELAYSLEKLSTHPLARAITRHGKRAGLAAVALEEYESVSGQGLTARCSGRLCLLGRREFVTSLADDGIRRRIAALSEELTSGHPGRSEVWVASGDLLGRILLRDDVRPHAAGLIRSLKAAGLKTLLLTGDRRANTEIIAAEMDLDEIRAELKPEDKLGIIQKLREGGEQVAMIGDGVNDAPSLAAATVSVAMGARGSDAALEQAEVVLMHDRLENFIAALRLSQRARRVIQQNLFISLGTVIVLVGFALAGEIPLTLGVLGHEGSTVIVVLNSLRLLFGPGAETHPHATPQSPT